VARRGENKQINREKTHQVKKNEREKKSERADRRHRGWEVGLLKRRGRPNGWDGDGWGARGGRRVENGKVMKRKKIGGSRCCEALCDPKQNKEKKTQAAGGEGNVTKNVLQIKRKNKGRQKKEEKNGQLGSGGVFLKEKAEEGAEEGGKRKPSRLVLHQRVKGGTIHVGGGVGGVGGANTGGEKSTPGEGGAAGTDNRGNLRKVYGKGTYGRGDEIGWGKWNREQIQHPPVAKQRGSRTCGFEKNFCQNFMKSGGGASTAKVYLAKKRWQEGAESAWRGGKTPKRLRKAESQVHGQNKRKQRRRSWDGSSKYRAQVRHIEDADGR